MRPVIDTASPARSARTLFSSKGDVNEIIDSALLVET
jgi:hypothetical protein